jgi:hypothetical protein
LYELTNKGKDLLPIMLAVIGWAEKYDPETKIASELGERIRTDLFGVRDKILTAMEHSSASPVLPLLLGEIPDAQIQSPRR